MKKFFKENWITLTISFLSAVVIWIYVVYQVNPTFETTIKNVPVTYTRYSQDFNNGKLILSDKSAETANIKIRGKRGVLSKIGKDDINCTVDMSNVSSSGTHKIPVNVSFNASGIELVSKDPYSVSINVDDVVTNELEINVDTRGTPADGYVYESLEYSVDKVRISGAKSIVKKVKKAKVNVDISDKSESQNGRYKIILEDKEGNEMSEEGITKNISYIEVKCNIYLLKEVKIKAKLSSDKNNQGKKVTAVIKPETIKVLGNNSEALDIDEVFTELIDVRYVKDGDKKTVELEKLSDKITVEDKLKSVDITFKVE